MKSARFLLTAGIALALALTLSCTSEKDSSPSEEQGKPDSSNGNVSGTFQDYRNGKAYKWVKIGEQIWMAENLNYAVEGSVCGGEIVRSSSMDGNTKTYNLTTENTVNCDKYGRLYRWKTAMNDEASSSANPSGVQGLCPDGWHIPSDAEWRQLTDFVGEDLYYEGNIVLGSDAALKLKANSDLWRESLDGWHGTDDYGFSALPGGYSDDGFFKNVGEVGRWWTATQYSNANNAYYWDMWYAFWFVNTNATSKSDYHSVRCVQD